MPADTDPPDDVVGLSVDGADGSVSALVCVALVLECVSPVSAWSDCCAVSSSGETGDVTVSLLWRAIDGSVRQIEALLRKSLCEAAMFHAARARCAVYLPLKVGTLLVERYCLMVVFLTS